METYCNHPEWKNSLAAMTKNVKNYVKSAKAQGITGMSFLNLRQCVSTKGCTIPVAMFDSLLHQAIADAKAIQFFYGESLRIA